MIYLDFDTSEDEHGCASLEAMASVPAAQVAAVQAEIQQVLDWAHAAFPGLQAPLNVAQNDGLSVKALVDIIQSKFNYKGKLTWDATKPDGAPKKVMDDTRFRQVFPEFKFTDFEEGIAETVKYYESVFPY